MVGMYFQNDELCPSCGGLTHPKFGGATCICKPVPVEEARVQETLGGFQVILMRPPEVFAGV